jgi:RNA polymerase sigma-70 factor (ECF subfamily)
MSSIPAPDETQELLKKAEGGNSQAVNDLFERHRGAVRRMLHNRLDKAIAQRVDASDIVQDVLIEANRRLSEYMKDPSMPFHVWLRCLARDHLITAQRRHRGAQKRSVDKERAINQPAYADHSSADLASMLAAKGLTPAADAIRRELQRRFEESLEQLNEVDREIIVMRHVEQLTNQEVANALELSEPAAGMRYLRALRRLKDILGTSPEESGLI